MNFKIENDNKILIMLLYYQRPTQVRDSLVSLKNQPYKNWHLAFIDDGSEDSGEQIVKSIFNEEELKKVTFYNTNDTKEEKKKRSIQFFEETKIEHPGTLAYNYFNTAMNEHDFDIAMFLCDDDAIYENHLSELNSFYLNNPNIVYSYSNIILFDHRYEKYYESNVKSHRFLRIGKVRGYFNLDTSQVSWRSSVFKKDNLRLREGLYPYFDAYWYEALYQKYGLCEPNFLISQYKNFDRNIYNL